MTVTYDPTFVDDNDRDLVRFHIGDKVEDRGPRPGDENFADEEITALVTQHGTWQAVVAVLFETLAAEWIRYPSFQADNFSISRSHIAKNYQTQADEWRKNHGLDSPQSSFGAPGSRAITRADGYSDDKDSATA